MCCYFIYEVTKAFIKLNEKGTFKEKKSAYSKYQLYPDVTICVDPMNVHPQPQNFSDLAMSVPIVQQKFIWIEHPTENGVISPDVDPNVMLNTSILYPTIVGSKICRTYEPPAKTEMRADPVAWPALTISLNSSEIITYVIYIHDKTMTTADYGGLYGGTFLYRPTLWQPNVTGSPFVEVYHIYKTEMDLLDVDEEPCHCPRSEECSEFEANIDFGSCIRDAVEEKINCTIPDMASGVPVARVGKGGKPLCSTPEQFGNYSQIYQSMELTSEGDIYKDYGCLPKCQGSSTWTMLHVT